MTLAPLVVAPPAIQIHVLVAAAAFALGAGQLLLTKGTSLHRRQGWVWVALMGVVAGSSFFIHQLRMWGVWSPIHLLSLATLAGLWRAIVAVRQGDVRTHGRIMAALFLFALMGAGAFTLLPGRLLHFVVFE